MDQGSPDVPKDSEQLDQVSQSDSLIDRGVDDPLDEGYVAPDNWSSAQGYGNTPAEMRQGETLEMRIRQEIPDVQPDRPKGDWNPDQESREVGDRRAGRLIATTGTGEDTESQVLAADVGISGGAASAEEAAMHIIEVPEQEPAEETEDED